MFGRRDYSAEMKGINDQDIHSCVVFFFCLFVWNIHLFDITWEQDKANYQLLTMVDSGGTQTCVNPHVSRPLYHCATHADMYVV